MYGETLKNIGLSLTWR